MTCEYREEACVLIESNCAVCVCAYYTTSLIRTHSRCRCRCCCCSIITRVGGWGQIEKALRLFLSELNYTVNCIKLILLVRLLVAPRRTIHRLETVQPVTSRLRALETDMLHNVFRLDIDLDTIELAGDYEVVNRDRVLPVANSGRIKFTLENVTARGLVGFKRNANDSMSTTNFNLDYSVEKIKIQVQYLQLDQQQPVQSELEYRNINDTFLKLFAKDLWYMVQIHVVKYNLDYVLSDISVQELFQHKKGVLQRYSLRGEALDRLANKMVDDFLRRTNKLILEKGLSKIPIDNFQRTFQQSWGLLTFSGSFEASDGYARNMSTIYRTGNFSIVHNPPTEFIAFGALGLKEFGFNFNKYKAKIWNVGPSGDIKAVARSNSVAFRMNVNGLNPNRPIYITDFDLYIERLE